MAVPGIDSSSRLEAGTEAGLPYDLVTRYRLNPWGDAGLAEIKALVRGTDVPLFCDLPDERVFFDLDKDYECPQFATDPALRVGLRATIAGTLKSNVTAVFTTRFRELGDFGDGRRPIERVLEVASVELRGLFYYPFSRRTFDRAGQLLEDQTGKLQNLGPRACSDTNLFAELSAAHSTRATVYAYEPAWMPAAVDAEPELGLVVRPQQPRTGLAALGMNENGWREWPTRVRNFQIAERGAGAAAGATSNLFRVLYAPRWLRQNRHLPGVTNAWIAWSSDDFNGAGAQLFESERIFDTRGELSTFVAHKLTSQGQPATKVAYRFPRPSPDSWQRVQPVPGTDRYDLSLNVGQDISGCDFLGFCLEAPAAARVSVKLRDLAHHTVLVVGQGGAEDKSSLSFWPAGQGRVSWIPNEIMPRHGSVVTAARDLVDEGQVFLVSVPELARAGLAVDRLASMDLSVEGSGTNSIRVTPPFRFEHGGPLIAPGLEPSCLLRFTAAFEWPGYAPAEVL